MKLAHRCTLTVSVSILFQAVAWPQWSSSPLTNTPITDIVGLQELPLSVANGDGSTWIGWFDTRSTSVAIYAQRLDAQGHEMLTHNGILVSNSPQIPGAWSWDMISDGAGGCVIVFSDTRNGPDLDAYAYRLDAAGNPLWGANGVTLSNDSDPDERPVVARTTDGSFVIAWSRKASTGTGDVRIQKLDGAGTPQYAGSGITIPGQAGEKPGFVQIAASDAGSYIVSYLRDVSTPASPRFLLAQKFDAAGVAQWNSGGPVVVYDANSITDELTPKLRSDGAGGAVLAWHRFAGLSAEVLNQRLNASGGEVFPHNGVVICLSTTNEFDPTLSVDPATGDAFIFFDKRTSLPSTWSLSVQRVSTSGALLFGNSAIDLIPLDGHQTSGLKSISYAGGAMCMCFRLTGPGQNILCGFRIDGNGNSVWGAAPTIVSAVPTLKQSVSLALDASGVLRMSWSENRPPSVQDEVFAQNLNADGSLGNVNTPYTSFCLGDGSGPACPCGNNATTPGRGCASAQYPGGALLVATRQAGASDATDTLKLTATDIPGPGLFFQANAAAALPSALGDGHLCASVGILRLGVVLPSDDLGIVFPTAGVATYPGGLTAQPIHIAGAPISAGDTKHYQCWYRSVPALCSVMDNFNLTNGVSLTWGP